MTKEVATGMNAIIIDGSVMPGAGLYFLKVQVNGEHKTMKLIKQ